MKNYSSPIRLAVLALVLLCKTTGMFAAPNVGQPNRKPQQGNSQFKAQLDAGCSQSKAQVDLDINNVRARIFSSGDMWWDLVGTAKYEVPKVTQAGQPSICSMFAGSLWIGGFENGNLKEAAMTYRQNGVDFYCGPLDTVTDNVANAGVCSSYDQLFEVTRAEIDAFRANPAALTNDITNWPGNGISGVQAGNIAHQLAPYVDVNHNMVYDPVNGDYPNVSGDQALWYVYNDKGGTHSETKADPIGLECQEMAFEFTTSDELNDMTFYKTIVINRSSNSLDSTWFGQWCDPDLGYAFDDYVGCDVSRNLGYDYNGEDFDPGLTGYGYNPPAVGAAFFHGPKDDKGKEIGLSKFIYYNNDANAVNGNPGYPNSNPADYYNYLAGHWKNGACVKYGADGTTGNQCTSYMYDGDPTVSNGSGGWTEKSAGNQPGDRRFLESSGSFTLLPGATNNVTVAVVWARTGSGGATGSIGALKLATDLAKVVYNNNFNILYGADAPNVNVRELDQKIVLSLQNTNTSNVEHYDTTWIDKNNDTVRYKFQGYLIYQLVNSSVSRDQYSDNTYARLIAQCDLKDSITGVITNYDTLPGVQGKVNIIQVASQANAGLSHTFEITTDAFAVGSDKSLKNYTTYYFSVLSYSTIVPSLLLNYEQNFVGSQHNVQTYPAVPHKNDAEFGGTQLNADYGSGPQITRIEGTGNGGNILDLTPASIDTILMNGTIAHPTYLGGKGPVNIKVYDPTILQPGNFQVKITDSTIKANPANGINLSENQKTFGTIHPVFWPSAKWKINDLSTNTTAKSENAITVHNEQILSTGPTDSLQYWGMSASIVQAYGPAGADVGLVQDPTNGFLQATMTFLDSSNHWLTGVANTARDGNYYSAGIPTPGNWIRSGQIPAQPVEAIDNAYLQYTIHTTADTFVAYDPFGAYNNLLGGIIAPAGLVARDGTGTPAGSLTMGDIPKNVNYNQTGLPNLNSVDLVFTPDQTKWSQCMVLEMGESNGLNEGGVSKFSLRAHASWNKGVDANGHPTYDNTSTGKSWFPGYAINVETGDRLNVFFSEDSHLPLENGADMLWNPTSDQVNNNSTYLDYDGHFLWGGKHWIYIMNSTASVTANNPYVTKYDGCATYYNLLSSNPSSSNIQKMWSSLIWVMEPALAVNGQLATVAQGIIPTETTIRLRVAKPYATLAGSTTTPVNNFEPMYTFSTGNLVPVRNSSIGKTAIDEVGISPNPYYAGSSYETSSLDYRVRFINVPTKCEITIYTLDGTLVRTFTTDQTSNLSYKSDGAYPATYLDWDLKNQKGVPIASGVYLIHVNGYDLGEKVIKWFGVMKPLNLDTF